MSLEFLRGPDDEKVERIIHDAQMAAFRAMPRQRVGDCPNCNTIETLMLGDVCHQCEANRRDAAASRSLCNLIHRRKAAE